MLTGFSVENLFIRTCVILLMQMSVNIKFKVHHRVTLRMVRVEKCATVRGWRKKIMENWKAQNSEGARWLRGTELELRISLHAMLKGSLASP
ncbi:hypothetical protein HAX54_002884, partial [Datura stramonium]|nr:hypothetical protein [Datura stramonium]